MMSDLFFTIGSRFAKYTIFQVIKDINPVFVFLLSNHVKYLLLPNTYTPTNVYHRQVLTLTWLNGRAMGMTYDTGSDPTVGLHSTKFWSAVTYYKGIIFGCLDGL